MGPLIIVAIGPNAAIDQLNELTSKDEIIVWQDFNNPPAGLVNEITQVMCTPSSETPLMSTGTILASIEPTTTTPPTTTPCISPPPTSTPPFPCRKNMIFLIDASNGMSGDQFNQQTAFISSIFAPDWTYDEIGLAIAQYDDDADDFIIAASFGDIKSSQDAQNAVSGITQFSNDPSLTS